PFGAPPGSLGRCGDGPFDQGDHVAGEQLLPLVLEEIHGQLAFLASRAPSQLTMAGVGAPGVKISSIPRSFNFGMSSLGMIPPPKTTTSSAPCARSNWTTRGNSVMCAPEWQESPTASASSWMAVSAIC